MFSRISRNSTRMMDTFCNYKIITVSVQGTCRIFILPEMTHQSYTTKLFFIQFNQESFVGKNNEQVMLNNF